MRERRGCFAGGRRGAQQHQQQHQQLTRRQVRVVAEAAAVQDLGLELYVLRREFLFFVGCVVCVKKERERLASVLGCAFKRTQHGRTHAADAVTAG